MNHVQTFNQAYLAPENVAIELQHLDINKVLRERYKCSAQFQMTKTLLWDMEVKKASRPDLFIPTVVKAGTAVSWGNQSVDNIDTFIRVSEQKLWLKPSMRGTVIENVHVDHHLHKVTFIGELTTTSPDYGTFQASTEQDIFHVQHGVIGEENNPLNTWKIVHLSSEVRTGLEQKFKEMNEYQWLPEYIEIYIREVLGISIERLV